ncbi:MAG TPA: alpha/beta fold hydrolase [Ktedonobacteraceae bacterium]|nr:alpha/beta fold hydrolase [Ktedonobacteraceae bacterium]
MMSNPAKTRWLQYWQRSPKARIRLFCFPYAGGSASIFRTWHQHLPQEVEVCPVQLPGREGRLSDRPFSDLHLLIDELVIALSPFLDMPYAFFGHSMGALVSFELTRYLQRVRSHPLPAHLFVSGRRAPQIPGSDPPTSSRSDADFIEELRRLKGTPELVLQNKELLTLLLPILRADFQLCETYTYRDDDPLRCSITAFGGLYDTEVPSPMIAAWREQTSLAFKHRFFDGDHFFLHKEQKALLTAIAQDIFIILQK